jgi:hypothetical protein
MTAMVRQPALAKIGNKYELNAVLLNYPFRTKRNYNIQSGSTMN